MIITHTQALTYTHTHPVQFSQGDMNLLKWSLMLHSTSLYLNYILLIKQKAPLKISLKVIVNWLITHTPHDSSDYKTSSSHTPHDPSGYKPATTLGSNLGRTKTTWKSAVTQLIQSRAIIHEHLSLHRPIGTSTNRLPWTWPRSRISYRFKFSNYLQ